MQGASLQTLLPQLLETLNQEQMQQVACTLQVIWNGRYNELHGERRKTAQAAANFDKQYLKDFNAAQVKVDEDHGRWKPSQQWRPPSNGIYKLNFDGAVNTVAKKGGIRILIRKC